MPAAENMPSMVIYEAQTAQTGVARMKVDEAPFDDPRVRRAIQACVDHDRLLQIAYQGLGVPGEDHHVAQIHPEYADIGAPQQDYDRARELLAEAGYEDGLEITIDCVAQPTWEPNTCEALGPRCCVLPASISASTSCRAAPNWDRWTTTPFGFTSWTHRPLARRCSASAIAPACRGTNPGYANPDF